MKISDETFLAIGMISLTIGIILGRIPSNEDTGFLLIDFIEGILYGVSLPLNLHYLIKKSKHMDRHIYGPRD